MQDQCAGHENAGHENARRDIAGYEIAGQCEMPNLYSLL